jgi:DNA repair protein SbcD/Mre11
MVKLLHAADIHLDSPLKGLERHEGSPHQLLRSATRRAFDNLVELALEEEVALLLIAGDLYDGDWKDYNTGLYFASRMGRLERAGIHVCLVSGNHDAASRLTKAMPLPGNVTVFSSRQAETLRLDHLAIAVHGRSYPTRAVTENLVADFPGRVEGYCNIGLLHTSLTGRPGHEVYAPCRIDDLLAKGYDYWALGHIHRREIVAERPWIVFSGNLQGRQVREEGAKGATLVLVEDGAVVEVQHRSLDVVRWHLCPLDLGECRGVEEVYDLARMEMVRRIDESEGRMLALRLILSGATAAHGELHRRSFQVTEELRGLAASLHGVWLEEVRFATRPHDNRPFSVAADSPLAGLLRTVEEVVTGEEILALVPELALLRSKLPAEVVSDEELLAAPGENQRQLLAEVRELLLAKLMTGEGR